MSTTRIYVVVNSITDKEELVRATSATQAVRHVAEKGWSAEVATPEVLVQMVSNGAKVQDASKAGDE